MPPVSETATRRKMDTASSLDRLSALPVELLQHVLSFLPSHEAVQTCVLARSWSKHWKSVPALRITDAKSYESAHALNKFVNYLLLLRDGSPILECELKTCHSEGGDETFRYMELWIRHSISCQVRVLTVCNDVIGERWKPPDNPLISKHLMRLKLYRVELEDRFVDFSSCPALEDLKMRFCTFLTKRIFSTTLKCLGITSCDFSGDVRTRISAPSLVSLKLDELLFSTPLVESMPSLVSAFVRLGEQGEQCGEWCRNGYEIGSCGDDLCEGCRDSNNKRDGCILLEGLSYAVHLELLADTRVFIFRKDLKWCPVFSKLKTLLVNEWFVTANLGALLCFLQHSPNLEKLTLQICESSEDIVEAGAGYDLTEQPFASKHLTVEVQCYEVDKRIRKMLEVLGTYGVPPEQIKIKKPPELGHDCWPSGLVGRSIDGNLPLLLEKTRVAALKVRLIGYCIESSLFLVYEFIENSNLSQHLRGTGYEPLSWPARVQIALDSARGLEYIHEHTVPVYVHRDIKSANILIDKNFRAKVADFGLTKLTDVGGTSLPARVVGTFGYMPPEYARYGDVSPKVDVYAFGVVLYELISAKEAIVRSTGSASDSRGLVYLFEEALTTPDPKEGLRKLVDRRLGEDYSIDSILKMTHLAKACTQEDPRLRPTMRSVVVALMTLSELWDMNSLYENQGLVNLMSGR